MSGWEGMNEGVGDEARKGEGEGGGGKGKRAREKTEGAAEAAARWPSE